MAELTHFGLVVLIASLVGVAALVSNRISERFRVPAPAIFLLGAALASDLWPSLGRVSIGTIEQVVTLALVVILFDGGMHIGWGRFRTAAAATVWLGVAGTVVTAGAAAWLAHLAFDLPWRTALLLGTAVAPTDPAVVFSVLGRREVAGRSGVMLEGESGANDPVGIALLVALLASTGSGSGAVGTIAVTFGLQLVIGAGVGLLGGRLLLGAMRLPLPSAALYPLRVLTLAMAIFGLATVAHGSGFLAVFVAGILIGDERAPYKGEVERFHSALASLAEVVAFVLLGLSVSVQRLPDGGAWWIGLVLALALTFVIRPLLVGLVIWRVRLTVGERLFVLWTGLKGAVPILLGVLILRAGVPDAGRLYAVIFVVVLFSVLVQGSLVPALAARLKVPLRTVDPEPWSLGVRFQHEPQGVHRLTVAAGAPVDGRSVGDLPVGEDCWISLVLRAGALVPVSSRTVLQAGDEVVVLAEEDAARVALAAIFGAEPEDPLADQSSAS
jgi:potassium/hydrogen antiporter